MPVTIHAKIYIFMIPVLCLILVTSISHAQGFKYSDEFEYLKDEYRGRAEPLCQSDEPLQKARDAVSRYFIANKNEGNVPERSFGTMKLNSFPSFFDRHCFYGISLTDWADNKTYDYLTAVNVETGEGTVYYVISLDRKYSRKILDVSSNMLTAYELHIDDLNKIIVSDNIEINDDNLRAYIKYAVHELLFLNGRGLAIFDKNSSLCQPNPYLKEEYDPNSLYGSAMIGLRELRAYMAPYCLGSGMSVYKLDGGAYAVHLVTWSEIMGYISEWDFTITRNGTIHIYEIRDIDKRIGPYIEIASLKIKNREFYICIRKAKHIQGDSL